MNPAIWSMQRKPNGSSAVSHVAYLPGKVVSCSRVAENKHQSWWVWIKAALYGRSWTTLKTPSHLSITGIWTACSPVPAITTNTTIHAMTDHLALELSSVFMFRNECDSVDASEERLSKCVAHYPHLCNSLALTLSITAGCLSHLWVGPLGSGINTTVGFQLRAPSLPFTLSWISAPLPLFSSPSGFQSESLFHWACPAPSAVLDIAFSKPLEPSTSA